MLYSVAGADIGGGHVGRNCGDGIAGRWDYAAKHDILISLPGQLSKPMSDKIILSVKPIWADKILSGEKTIELRRRFMKPSRYPITAFLYSSSPTKALVGVANIEGILIGPPEELRIRVQSGACVIEDQYRAYFEGADEAVALMLTAPIRLGRPISLAELRSFSGFSPPMSWRRIKPAELDLVEGRT